MMGVSAIGSVAWRQSYYAMGVSATRAAAANPLRAETPVEPVTPVKPVPGELPVQIPVPVSETALPTGEALNNPGELIARMRIQYPDGEKFDPVEFWEKNLPGASDKKTAAEAFEEGECETCKRRKYQDGSDDPGVSFKTPTNIAPEAAASAVMGHEQEHVVRERAAAEREGREVVSQYVSIHTDICPECGRVYVSGGETVTTTAEKPEPLAPSLPEVGEAAA